MLAVPLKGIRTGARLVGAHACTHLSIVMNCLKHKFDVLTVVHCTQSREHIERILPKAYSVVFEMCRALIILVPPENAVFLRHSHHTFDTGQALHGDEVQRFGITNQINLGQGLFGSAFDMHARLNSRQSGQMSRQLLVVRPLLIGIGRKYQNHGSLPLVICPRVLPTAAAIAPSDRVHSRFFRTTASDR